MGLVQFSADRNQGTQLILEINGNCIMNKTIDAICKHLGLGNAVWHKSRRDPSTSAVKCVISRGAHTIQ